MFELSIPINETNPDPRVACVVLADVSGSMSGAPIAALEEGFAAFVQYVTTDDLARKRAEVGVITFGTTADVVVPLQEARSLQSVPFRASGTTNMADAINLALDMIENRKVEYKASGIQYFRPWLMVLTDGVPNEAGFDAAVNRLNSAEAAKGVTVFPIGVGQHVDNEQLGRLSQHRAPAALAGLRFEEFFEWLSASLGNMASSSSFGKDDAEVAGRTEQIALPPIGWATA